ncbi:zinc-finger-ran binding domain-containing protein [Cyclospora cayetanensis]|uniref:Zinc-finger-ran binding domain-containing protein n=1 Tax=Cyclospora cayetanensis TaxID=88456 RepID=A0A1D3DA31_9EIME|nr:zinc-finger-ran binding domain-containing protein [Cyclospora cayetanensis]
MEAWRRVHRSQGETVDKSDIVGGAQGKRIWESRRQFFGEYSAIEGAGRSWEIGARRKQQQPLCLPQQQEYATPRWCYFSSGYCTGSQQSLLRQPPDGIVSCPPPQLPVPLQQRQLSQLLPALKSSNSKAPTPSPPPSRSQQRKEARTQSQEDAFLSPLPRRLSQEADVAGGGPGGSRETPDYPLTCLCQAQGVGDAATGSLQGTAAVMLALKARDLRDGLLAELQQEGLSAEAAAGRAADILGAALALTRHAHPRPDAFGKNLISWMQGVGGPNFAAPTMLAHPDEFRNPSSFLKIYGDPMCCLEQQAQRGGAPPSCALTGEGGAGAASAANPVRGRNGNWLCRSCSNVNFPRRFRCNKCGAPRGPEGDAVVADAWTRLSVSQQFQQQ